MCCCLCKNRLTPDALVLRLNLVVKFFSRADASSQALCGPARRKITFAPPGNGFIKVQVIHKNPKTRRPRNLLWKFGRAAQIAAGGAALLRGENRQ
jgi:hypothetical protein